MGKPNYNRIYSDIIRLKFPDKLLMYQNLLNKKELGVLEVIDLNRKLFGTSDVLSEKFNQRLRSYDRRSIIRMLEYQRDHRLNNIQLARHFNLSRNTVAVWKKKFLVKK